MTTCFLAPDPIQSTNFIPGTNTPASGAQLFFYTAQSVSTKATVYKDMNGSVAHSNPIVLDTGGNIPSGGEVWFPQGTAFKVVFAPATDSDPPTSPYWSKDNLSGQNDVTGAQSEWVQGPTPTFLSATSFSLAGDQTLTFTAGRRVKTTNTGGTIYSTIVTSVFGSVTTVTVVNDTGVLDAGLSAVFYGLISAVNTSEPGTHATVCFTSNATGLTTTWTATTPKAWISASGGGGGGGGRTTSAPGAGAGGGGGQWVIKKEVSLTPLTIYTIRLGAGGAGGDLGLGSTGASTFMSSVATGVVISLGGGVGGSSAGTTVPMLLAGGSSFVPGSFGGYAMTGSTVSGPIASGAGGNTPWGVGGKGAVGTLGSVGGVSDSAAGQAGINGAGGSGALNPINASNSGGPGGAGIFIIEW